MLINDFLNLEEKQEYLNKHPEKDHIVEEYEGDCEKCAQVVKEKTCPICQS